MILKFCTMRTLHWLSKKKFGTVPTILVVQAGEAVAANLDGTLSLIERNVFACIIAEDHLVGTTVISTSEFLLLRGTVRYPFGMLKVTEDCLIDEVRLKLKLKKIRHSENNQVVYIIDKN